MAAGQLVGSEIHGFHTWEDLDFENIMLSHAGRRWLVPHEVHAILCNYKHLNHLISVNINQVHLPKSGTILLFDRKILKNFRRDGHNWKKKKDGKTVNESHERLKVGNEERIHVYYVRGQENSTFARRCYWLLDENLRHIVLVHYLEESGDKDCLGPGDNLTVQNHEGKHHKINSIQFNCQVAWMMSQKRKREDVKAQPEGSGSVDKRRRFPTFRNVVWEVMMMQSVQNFMKPIIEPLIHRLVKEQVEITLRKHSDSMKQQEMILGNCGNEIHTSESRSLQLKFINNPSVPVFTGDRIEGEDRSNIQVALVDTHTAQPVTSGPASSGEVEIVVLEGDEHDNWTAEEFQNNVVREREGKKPLLTGDRFVYLKDGTGVVVEISFTDNSSWTRSRMFRLGVRFIDNIEGIRVKEAKTEPFIVGDHPRESFEHREKVISYDEEASSSHLTNVHYPTESSNGSKFLASHKIGDFDYTQKCAPSPDIFATIYSFWGLDEDGLHNIDSMGLRCDQALSFPGQVTSSLSCDRTDPRTQAFCDEDLQFFDTAIHSQNLELEPSSDLQSGVDDFLLVAPSITVAQMRWTKVTKVISVCKWFSILKVIS